MQWDNSTITIIVTTLGSVGSAVWWLSNQFKEMRTYVQDTVDKMEASFLDKLEYHERHDDKRFSDIVNSLWELRLRNAAIEGITTTREIKANKRENDALNG